MNEEELRLVYKTVALAFDIVVPALAKILYASQLGGV